MPVTRSRGTPASIPREERRDDTTGGAPGSPNNTAGGAAEGAPGGDPGGAPGGAPGGTAGDAPGSAPGRASGGSSGDTSGNTSEYTASTAATDTSATSTTLTASTARTREPTETPASPAGEEPLRQVRGGLAHPDKTIKVRRANEDRPPRATTSKASTTTSRRTAKLLKAKEELLRLKIELAATRVANIEQESDTEEELDPAEEREQNLKVGKWLDNNPPPLAIANEPHNAPEPPPPPPKELESGKCHAASIDLSELAAAIAQAARAGQPRHTVDLPIFTGAHQEWLSFKATYIESKSGYTAQENLARLRRSLKGKAREAVESLLIYGSSADEVMKTLESRFGRPDAIAIAETEKIRSLPRLTDAPRELCVFASRITNAVSILGAIGKQQYLYNPEITKLSIEKLTPTLRYRWYDFAAAQTIEEPEIARLARFLNREAELCSPYAQPEQVTEAVPYRKTQKAFITQETVRREERSAKQNQHRVNNCPVCNKEHSIVKCEEFEKAEVAARWDMAKEKRLCFRCLRYRNRTHSCKGNKCNIDECIKMHHPLLHHKIEQKSEIVSSTWTERGTQAFLKIVPVKIIGPKRKIDTYALLDDGSTVTLIDEDLAQRAGLRGPREPIRIEAIGETNVDTSNSRRLSFLVGNTGKQHRIVARSIKGLKLSPQTVRNEDIVGCRHLEDIAGTIKYSGARPQLLIGQDNWHLLLAEDRRIGNKQQPIASLTALGWVLHGACARTTGHRVHFICDNKEEREHLDVELKNFFSLEALTIVPKQPRNDPEVKALKLLEEKTTKLEDGRFQCSLLWKSEDIKMPNNREYALRRLESTERKIDKDPKLKSRVIEEMNKLIEKGYAEPAPSQSKVNKTWYLPCFPVFNPEKPNKLRMVHDAAATHQGMSLNSALLTGPDLLQSLPGVLMRMRQHKIAVSADIAEMFLQVKIAPEDRDAIRYLWRNGERSAPPKEYRMTSLIFGATSSPATAIYVKNRNAKDHQEQYPAAATAIERNHYVDDYIQSFESEETAIETAKQVREVHNKAHFQLRKWASNSMKVLTELQENIEEKELSIGPDTAEKVLGMIWQTSTDSLKYNLGLTRLPNDILQRTPTKRQALRIIMSLYDPLGLVSPVTSKAKQILQEIWKRSTDWDAELEEDLAEQWTTWTAHLQALKNISIPRSYSYYSQGKNLQLHIFVDASETAYTAALYWRVEDDEGHPHVSLVLAKTRVAPLKTTSIPRLELQAAVMGSRMASSVIEEHDRKPESRIFWTDSRTVLTWLRTGARSYKPFVAHRIAELEENTKIEEWRWVPTKLNVADDGTREVPKDFNSTHRWFTGPPFLSEVPALWPRETTKSAQPTGEERTLKIENKKPSVMAAIPDFNRFSSWERYIRSTARVLQFIDECKYKIVKTTYARTRANKKTDPTWGKREHTKKEPVRVKKEEKIDKYKKVSTELLLRAEDIVIRAIQEDSFAGEVHDLSNNRRVGSSSKLRKIAVELINGIIVVKSRIAAATGVPEETKRPPIIDGRHHVARLYIEHIHRAYHHQGVEATINHCRQRYHVLGLRTTARSIIHRCTSCRRRRWAPPEPPTGDHPASRLAHHHRPFSCTGLDYFGPFQVVVGRATKKVYGALFTCLTTRAIHLEIAGSLTTDSAIMALRRFIARRGCPDTIWSDNGTNLHGAAKELRQTIDNATELEASKKRIRWRFIPPGAPFMGGTWERMVKAVKTALAAVMDNRATTEEVLSTLFAEVEMTVNSRPLTHVSVDPEDPVALTPNHFLLLGPAHAPSMGESSPSDLHGRSHWRKAQQLADMYWARWLKEYLPELQNRREPRGRGLSLQLGDIVLVADNTLPRNTWPLGKIVAVYPGPDNIVRTADVKTKGGTLRRPVKKLVILQQAETTVVLHPEDTSRHRHHDVRRENVPDDAPVPDDAL